MINTDMEISDIIETIAKSNSGLDTFYFEMKDTNAMQTAYVENHAGESVSACVYPSVKITSHFTYGSEDAIAFLFDADIRLWKLVDWNITRDWHDSKQWTIKLMR